MGVSFDAAALGVGGLWGRNRRERSSVPAVPQNRRGERARTMGRAAPLPARAARPDQSRRKGRAKREETAMDDENRPPTSDRLRIDIDRGSMGDKVAWPDPAAAPLGTDDEAGGAPPTAEERALAAEQERRTPAPERDGRLFAGQIMAAALFVATAIAALAVFAMR
jgi:hypothetical protein